jgi:hypothetical protein
MVEETDKVWMSEFEKNGIQQVVEILENYGIDSEVDVSFLDQDDLSTTELMSQELKSLDEKKLQCWCDSVRTRADNMLYSS